MKKILEKLNDYRLPINVSHLALAFSLLAVGFVASSVNTPCLQAQATCAAGGNNEFTGNISVKGGTPYKATFDASGISADRTLTIPNADGTLALTSDIPSTPSLTADKVMATDGTGAYSTTDVYPLTLSASKSLSTDGSGNVETNDVYPLTLSASKSLSTDGSGNLETNDVYPLTLSASTPLKTNGSGEVTASDLDITTDITPGSALQEIRVNAGGTALEYFTPSGGSDVTKVASGNIIMNSAFGALPQTGANICWFTQAGTLDDTKSYKLVVNFKLNENQSIANNNNQTRRGYINTLFKQSWATDCGDTSNNNNGANYTFWSMTQNMPTDISPNNTSFGYINGYAETSGTQYETCCAPILPYAYNSPSSGVNGSHISANQLIVEFSPAQDSVLSSGYKVGVTGTYKSNGLIAGGYTNPTYNNFGAWQVMGNFTNPGATQNNSSVANELKFEDFQGFKVGCNTNSCFGGDSTWALYEFSN